MVGVSRMLILAMAVWSALSSSLAWGEESCRIFDDKRDQFSFGRALLGGGSKGLFPPDLPPDCAEGGTSYEEDECYYRDTDGILYTAFEYKILAKELYDQDLAAYRGTLIAGIAWHDTLDEVRRKLRALPDTFPKWDLIASSDGDLYFLATGPCLRASNGTIWKYILMFDKNARLIDVSVSVGDYTNST